MRLMCKLNDHWSKFCCSVFLVNLTPLFSSFFFPLAAVEATPDDTELPADPAAFLMSPSTLIIFDICVLKSYCCCSASCWMFS